jgi:hypothetical protein
MKLPHNKGCMLLKPGSLHNNIKHIIQCMLVPHVRTYPAMSKNCNSVYFAIWQVASALLMCPPWWAFCCGRRNTAQCPEWLQCSYSHSIIQWVVLLSFLTNPELSMIQSLTTSHVWFSYKIQPFKALQLLYVPPGLTFTNSTFCPHSVFMCFVWISEQTVIISLYSINWLVFITETECVYCVVQTEYLYIYIYINHQV